MTSSALREPAAPLLLPGREVAHLGQALVVAHALEHAIELRLLGKPFRVELGHDRERLVEEAQASVGIELRGAGGHSVGQLALRFDVPRKLGARVLQVLDVDREAGDRAGRQRHVDDAQHPPLAANDRRLHARYDACRFRLRLARASRRRCPRPAHRSARRRAQ